MDRTKGAHAAQHQLTSGAFPNSQCLGGGDGMALRCFRIRRLCRKDFTRLGARESSTSRKQAAATPKTSCSVIAITGELRAQANCNSRIANIAAPHILACTRACIVSPPILIKHVEMESEDQEVATRKTEEEADDESAQESKTEPFLADYNTLEDYSKA